MKRSMLLFVMACLLLAFATVALAGDGIEVRDTDTVSDVLKRNSGKRVELTLVSGDRMAGTVSRVTPVAVHLSKLTGKEFYDAVVRLESVTAVVIRARGN